MPEDRVLEALQVGLDACNDMNNCCGCKVPRDFVEKVKALGYDVDEDECKIAKTREE
jgi:hypothetical protein